MCRSQLKTKKRKVEGIYMCVCGTYIFRSCVDKGGKLGELGQASVDVLSVFQCCRETCLRSVGKVEETLNR